MEISKHVACCEWGHKYIMGHGCGKGRGGRLQLAGAGELLCGVRRAKPALMSAEGCGMGRRVGRMVAAFSTHDKDRRHVSLVARLREIHSLAGSTGVIEL